MRTVVQRVSSARVRVDERIVGEIGLGLLALVGVEDQDSDEDVRYTATKVRELRIFEDEDGKMNRSLVDVGGAALVVSQFTLCADVRRGRRPSFDAAAPPDEGRRRYEQVVALLRDAGLPVHTGEFQAHMHVELVNDGPVTILLDSRKRF